MQNEGEKQTIAIKKRKYSSIKISNLAALTRCANRIWEKRGKEWWKPGKPGKDQKTELREIWAAYLTKTPTVPNFKPHSRWRNEQKRLLLRRNWTDRTSAWKTLFKTKTHVKKRAERQNRLLTGSPVPFCVSLWRYFPADKLYSHICRQQAERIPISSSVLVQRSLQPFARHNFLWKLQLHCQKWSTKVPAQII